MQSGFVANQRGVFGRFSAIPKAKNRRNGRCTALPHKSRCDVAKWRGKFTLPGVGARTELDGDPGPMNLYQQQFSPDLDLPETATSKTILIASTPRCGESHGRACDDAHRSARRTL